MPTNSTENPVSEYHTFGFTKDLNKKVEAFKKELDASNPGNATKSYGGGDHVDRFRENVIDYFGKRGMGNHEYHEMLKKRFKEDLVRVKAARKDRQNYYSAMTKALLKRDVCDEALCNYVNQVMAGNVDVDDRDQQLFDVDALRNLARTYGRTSVASSRMWYPFNSVVRKIKERYRGRKYAKDPVKYIEHLQNEQRILNTLEKNGETDSGEGGRRTRTYTIELPSFGGRPLPIRYRTDADGNVDVDELNKLMTSVAQYLKFLEAAGAPPQLLRTIMSQLFGLPIQDQGEGN